MLIESESSQNKSIGMDVQAFTKTRFALLMAGLITTSGLCGCQTNIGGQTLPSAYYLRDDIQYFPSGPEFLLPNTVRAMEEYNASQAALADDLE